MTYIVHGTTTRSSGNGRDIMARNGSVVPISARWLSIPWRLCYDFAVDFMAHGVDYCCACSNIIVFSLTHISGGVVTWPHVPETTRVSLAGVLYGATTRSSRRDAMACQSSAFFFYPPANGEN